jgi:ADP-heptose:LPS heptosyltransferase
MTVKTAVKKVARRGLLWNLRVAARPTLRYEAAPPDFSHAPRKLLVVRPDHLGDMLLMTPALAWLRRNFPETHITVLAGTWGTASLENNPDIDHIQRCDFPGFSREAKSSPLSPYAYALEQSRKLRAQGYDAAINFRPDFWWGALLLYLADIPIRIGYNWQESKGFYTHEIPLALPPDFALPFGQSARHSTSLNLRLAAAFGELYGKPAQISPAEGILRFQPSAEDERYIKMLLAEWGIQPGDKLVAIHPGTGATIKLWTVESFAAVADGLARQPNVRVVLTGTEISLKSVVPNRSNWIRRAGGDAPPLFSPGAIWLSGWIVGPCIWQLRPAHPLFIFSVPPTRQFTGLGATRRAIELSVPKLICRAVPAAYSTLSASAGKAVTACGRSNRRKCWMRRTNCLHKFRISRMQSFPTFGRNIEDAILSHVRKEYRGCKPLLRFEFALQ